MTKKICLGILFLSCCNVFSQIEKIEYLPNFDKRKLHYGFYLGLNYNDFKLNYKPSLVTNPNIEVQPGVGFNVGLVADLRLHNNINLRFEPGLISNSKTILFKHLPEANRTREASSTYMHIPLVFKFSSNRYKNIRPYALAGASYDLNFSSNERNSDDNSAGEFRMTSQNFMYEVGVGVDIYLYYFKFSPSIRAVFSLNNELKYDDNLPSVWTDPINFMGTHGIFLNFAFEGAIF